MQEPLARFIHLLEKKNKDDLIKFYKQLDDLQKTGILLFLFTKADQSQAYYSYFQTLCVLLTRDFEMPKSLISKIINLQLLNFFTPLLQQLSNFNARDKQDRNILHYLFVAKGQCMTPPFTFIKSLLLFESNLFLPKAIIQKECNGLTPIEVFLHFNTQDNVMPSNEVTSLLGLIEVEQSQRPPNRENLLLCKRRLVKQFRDFDFPKKVKQQKCLLAASYYRVHINSIVPMTH